MTRILSQDVDEISKAAAFILEALPSEYDSTITPEVAIPALACAIAALASDTPDPEQALNEATELLDTKEEV